MSACYRETWINGSNCPIKKHNFPLCYSHESSSLDSYGGSDDQPAQLRPSAVPLLRPYTVLPLQHAATSWQDPLGAERAQKQRSHTSCEEPLLQAVREDSRHVLFQNEQPKGDLERQTSRKRDDRTRTSDFSGLGTRVQSRHGSCSADGTGNSLHLQQLTTKRH